MKRSSVSLVGIASPTTSAGTTTWPSGVSSTKGERVERRARLSSFSCLGCGVERGGSRVHAEEPDRVGIGRHVQQPPPPQVLLRSLLQDRPERGQELGGSHSHRLSFVAFACDA